MELSNHKDMQKKTKQDYLNLLDETVKYYSEDTSRRGINKKINSGNFCMYHTPEGNMCAVGRCTIKPKAVQERWGDLPVFMVIGKYKFNASLKPEYRGFESWIWKHLQDFHDDKLNWGPSGLTKGGEVHLKTLKRLINRKFK